MELRSSGKLRHLMSVLSIYMCVCHLQKVIPKVIQVNGAASGFNKCKLYYYCNY